MSVKEYVEKYLAPRIMGDGGWVEFVSFENGVLSLIFRGECSKCIVLDRCLDWMKEEIRRDLGLEVKIEGKRIKPFFWDVN